MSEGISTISSSRAFCLSGATWIRDNPVLVTTIGLAIIAGIVGVIYGTDLNLASKIIIGTVAIGYTIAIPLLFLASVPEDEKLAGLTSALKIPEDHSHSHCHHDHAHSPQSEKLQKVMKVLEVVSLVVLAVIACYTNYKLFLPFFGAGILLGTYMHWKTEQKPTLISGSDGGGCSQGFLEQLTGVKLPAPIGLAVNVAMTYEHIVHHSKIFPPIIGLNAGYWVGKYLGYYIPVVYRSLTTKLQEAHVTDCKVIKNDCSFTPTSSPSSSPLIHTALAG